MALLTGCTGTGDAGSPSGASSPQGATPAAPSRSQAPPAAGRELAAAAARLPLGAATGSVTVSWSGLGELAGPITGSCSRAGDVTLISGRSDTATLDFRFAPSGSSLKFLDEGVQTTTALAKGDYQVDGGTMTVRAELLGGGGAVGTLTAQVTCG